MKLHERINYVLIGILWSLTILLVLDFWLNTVYNFNMFSNTHWRYVAELQAANQSIAPGFYLAITIAIIGEIIGLYIMFRPKFRKIVFSTQKTQPTITTGIPTNNNISHLVSESQPDTHAPQSQNNIIMQLPPRLHIQPGLNQQKHSQQIQTKQTKATLQKPMYTHEMREIFENNGYRVLSPKNIAHVPISLIALGTNETLWIGAHSISHEKMADAMLALKSVFQETLDGIEIDLNGFILEPTDTDKANGILDFDSIDALSDTIEKVPNETNTNLNPDIDSMDAFVGYIETVLTYLGNK